MAIELYFASDLPSVATKLIDLADVNGTFNPGSVKTKVRGIDAGSYAPEMGLFAPDTGDGSFRTKRRNPSVPMTIQLRTQASSQDNHRLFLDRLFGLLEYPRVLVYKGEGMAERRYIRTLGADSVDQLLRGGQDNYDQVARQFQDADLLLTLERQPIILDDELLSTVNALSNSMLMVDQDGTNGATTGRPDMWTWRTTAGAADATPISAESCGGTGDGYTFTMAAGSVRDLTQDYTVGVAPGDVWAGQFVFEAAAGVRCLVAIQYLNAGVLVGAETASAFVVGTGTGQRLTIVSAAAPATSNQVRIKLRVENTSGGALVVILRRSQLEEAAAASRFRAGGGTVPNDLATTNGRLRYFWNDGEAPVPVQVLSAMDASSTVAAMLVGKRGNNGVSGVRRLGDLNESRYMQAENTERGWTVTLYNDTTQPVAADDADASGDGGGAGTNYIRMAHTLAPSTSKRRFRATRATLLDSLRGRWNVYGRFRLPATARQFAVRLKWAPSLTDPATESESEVLLDSYTRTTATTDGPVTVTTGFIDVALGAFELPTDPAVSLAGLALEVWSRCTKPDSNNAGSDVTPVAANLDLDHLWFVPADVSAYEDAAGAVFLEGAGAEKVIGRTLISPPDQITGDPVWVTGSRPSSASSVIRLNGVNESAGWNGSGTGGTVLGTGRHRFTFNIAADKLTGVRTVYVRVVNNTDNVVVPGAFNTYLSKKAPSTIVLEFDGVAGKEYQPQVNIFAYGAGSPGNAGFLDVGSILYEAIPYLVSGEQFRADPQDRFAAEKLDAAGAVITTVRASGELPFIADRGASALFFRHDEIPLQYYLDRQNKKVRTPTVAFRYRPGRYEL